MPGSNDATSTSFEWLGHLAPSRRGVDHRVMVFEKLNGLLRGLGIQIDCAAAAAGCRIMFVT